MRSPIVLFISSGFDASSFGIPLKTSPSSANTAVISPQAALRSAGRPSVLIPLNLLTISPIIAIPATGSVAVAFCFSSIHLVVLSISALKFAMAVFSSGALLQPVRAKNAVATMSGMV